MSHISGSKCIACPPGVSSSLNITQTNRIINKQVRVSSSLYTTNLVGVSYVSPTLSNKIYTNKHNSYARFLAKKKGILKKYDVGIIRTTCPC